MAQTRISDTFRPAGGGGGGVREIRGDLFEIGKGQSLAHCVSEDLRMGAGIAVYFRVLFARMDDLREQRTKTGGVAVIHSETGRTIYYMVTKRNYWDKPTLEDVRRSLEAMLKHATENGVDAIFMPRIASGLDALPWSDVRGVIDAVFADGPVAVTICTL
jgi:O-acetyl-ADP-ribose deacetylase (regulator of RNase III)